MLDKEISRQQIQSLNNAEAIVAFFAYLGYDTNSRIQQTPANLGITSEAIQRQIKRTERIADQRNLLSVYLVEMTSVTIAGIQGIIRPMRNRAGQYLFVLTGDYEKIDFVLLQRITPEGEGKGLAQKQVGVRPACFDGGPAQSRPGGFKGAQTLQLYGIGSVCPVRQTGICFWCG